VLFGGHPLHGSWGLGLEGLAFGVLGSMAYRQAGPGVLQDGVYLDPGDKGPRGCLGHPTPSTPVFLIVSVFHL
jgi:hypothetical protein